MTEISVDFKTFSVKIAVNLPTFRSVFLAGVSTIPIYLEYEQIKPDAHAPTSTEADSQNTDFQNNCQNASINH